MFEPIEKLLILQDRDKQIRRVKTELNHIEPERQMLKAKTASAQTALESLKQKVKSLESHRRELELEVQAKKQLIERYATQQFETRKNEEYRALAHEIELCKADITKIEDQEIELMEQGETAQREVGQATRGAAEAQKLMDDQLAQLARRQEKLQKELAEAEANRKELAGAVDEEARRRYDQLVGHKGGDVVVGVQHGVCGGCHMRLPAQILVTCQAEQEIVTCINCGRLLYYTRDMNLAVAD